MISDRQLHAFVDQQLSVGEQGEILSEAARSPELARRIADLQQLKQLVQHGYKTAVPESHGEAESLLSFVTTNPITE